MECYTPYPVEEAAEALHFHKTRVPLVCLLGGLMGVTTAGLMETWINVWAYPLNIAGRPLFSWPAFIIPAYEWTILFAGLSAAFGMIALNGLPQLYHPLFNAPNFRDGATTDKFFLCLEAVDPKFSLTETRALLESFAAVSVVGGRPLMQRQGTGDQGRGTRRTRQWQSLRWPLRWFWLDAGRIGVHDQPKFFPQRGTDFYADGRSVRPQVENTVARGQLHEDSYFYTGLVDGKEGDGLPFPVTAQVLARGQERYNVYCTPCHSRVGNGAGMIVDRGYAPAGNFHTVRLESAPLGPLLQRDDQRLRARCRDYAAQIAPVDRWAIVAYIKALQLSQKAAPADVSGGREGAVAPEYCRKRRPASVICGGVDSSGDGDPWDSGRPALCHPGPTAGQVRRNDIGTGGEACRRGNSSSAVTSEASE